MVAVIQKDNELLSRVESRGVTVFILFLLLLSCDDGKPLHLYWIHDVLQKTGEKGSPHHTGESNSSSWSELVTMPKSRYLFFTD
jgi:hypothetical protein